MVGTMITGPSASPCSDWSYSARLLTGLAASDSCGRRSSVRGSLLPERSERRSDLFGEQLGFFPGGEVAASVKLVVMDEVVGIRALCPAPRGLVELVGKDADGERDGDVLGVEEVGLVLPIQASGGDPGVRQPVERDVVEEVVSREVALVGPLKDLFHEPGLAGAVAVVKHERRQIDG